MNLEISMIFFLYTEREKKDAKRFSVSFIFFC